MRKRTEEESATNEVWSVTFGLSERNTGDDLRRVEMSWQNRTTEQIAENLNAFLVAAKAPLKVVPVE